ncbi:MAG: 2Fe-2S iron-sulfur cluster binding domain-containing protein [Burkholderiales bacterium]|nr:2Fe-2S iron-sulfur cluster binding domain-containing protein [Burkholderiales bacterium]
MKRIIFEGQSYDCKETESILDCLTTNGVPVPSSCKAGVCQTCLMRALQGSVPPESQRGLKSTLVERNYFMACSCYPVEDMEVALSGTGAGKMPATVVALESLNSEIICVKLHPSGPFEYRSGQYVNFFRDASTARSYSLASVPKLDDCIELHVRKVPQGQVSTWIHESLSPGDTVEISEASGDCFYVPGNPDQGLLLIGTGSGLAPLYGIIRDALLQGHSGPIRLYHGSLIVAGLYLMEELRQLARECLNFTYTPCVSEGAAPEGFSPGIVLDVALKDTPRLSGWRVYLCGNPAMVNAAKKKTFFAGASMRDIHADPF